MLGSSAGCYRGGGGGGGGGGGARDRRERAGKQQTTRGEAATGIVAVGWRLLRAGPEGLLARAEGKDALG